MISLEKIQEYIQENEQTLGGISSQFKDWEDDQKDEMVRMFFLELDEDYKKQVLADLLYLEFEETISDRVQLAAFNLERMNEDNYDEKY